MKPQYRPIQTRDKFTGMDMMKQRRNAMAEEDYMKAEAAHEGLEMKAKKRKRMMAMRKQPMVNALASLDE